MLVYDHVSVRYLCKVARGATGCAPAPDTLLRRPQTDGALHDRSGRHGGSGAREIGEVLTEPLALVLEIARLTPACGPAN